MSTHGLVVLGGLAWMVVAGLLIKFNQYISREEGTACNGDCLQGRECNCTDSTSLPYFPMDIDA